MATNLRLRADAERAVREHAARTGKSQQELIREAVDRYLGLERQPPVAGVAEAMVASGIVLPARTTYRELDQLIALPGATTTEGLLGRDEQR